MQLKMKTAWLLAVLAVFGIALIGCGGAEQTQTETPAAEAQTPQQKTTGVEPYPLDYCLVSGEKLGSMGEPAVQTYMGREIKFCCAGCIPSFRENPGMYIAKLDSAKAGLLKHPEGGMQMEGHEGHGHGG